MYKITYMVDAHHLEKTKESIFKAGAGHMGSYKYCCTVTEVIGQFQPTADSNPSLGEVDKLIEVKEYCVNTFCEKSKLADVINALKKAHPFEVLPLEVTELVTDYKT